MPQHSNMMDTHHPDYDDTIDEVKTVRDAIEGSNAIKTGKRSSLFLGRVIEHALARDGAVAARQLLE